MILYKIDQIGNEVVVLHGVHDLFGVVLSEDVFALGQDRSDKLFVLLLFNLNDARVEQGSYGGIL